MQGTQFMLAMMLAAGMLAWWVDVRLADDRPQTPAQLFVHAGLSVFALLAAVGLLYLVHGVPQALFMVAVLTVFFPALVYAVLAGFWLVRAAADLSGLAGR